MIRDTMYGFAWNNVTVERTCSDDKNSVVAISTDYQIVHIRITRKTGKIVIEPVKRRQYETV